MELMKITKSTRERYEKRFVSSLLPLLNIPDIQRVVSQERVNELYASFVLAHDAKRLLLTPGVIVLGELPDNRLLLLDGQHRIRAYERLLKTNGSDQCIVVNIIKVGNQEDAIELFNLINNTVPALQIPSGIEPSHSRTVMNHFMEKYPSVIKQTTGSVHRPNVSYNALNEAVNKMLGIYTPEGVIGKIEELNRSLSNSSASRFKQKRDTTEKLESLMMKCIEKGGFFIGMCPGLECFDVFYESEREYVKPRKRITPILRLAVWKRYMGADTDEGECALCSARMTLKNCHMAHDIAHAKGGDEGIENLYPCCAPCNLKMGTRDTSFI
jgi:hypothetical protein